ncbi:TetR/AcrR family transcriptional regulator [Paenibacillus marinisediminis]
MKREEKNLQSRLKIVEGALAEFGEKSYVEASLNNICSTNGISKGIIYHYFKDKDELYLVCVQKCFDALTADLSNLELPEGNDIETTMQCYFDARLSFFGQHPLLFNIFRDAVAVPPLHLREAIGEIKSRFDAFNIEILTKLLEQAKLRKNINIEEAVSNFCHFQDYFNFQYHKVYKNCLRDEPLPKHHEESCKRFLDILLYGMVERETEDEA